MTTDVAIRSNATFSSPSTVRRVERDAVALLLDLIACKYEGVAFPKDHTMHLRRCVEFDGSLDTCTAPRIDLYQFDNRRHLLVVACDSDLAVERLRSMSGVTRRYSRDGRLCVVWWDGA